MMVLRWASGRARRLINGVLRGVTLASVRSGRGTESNGDGTYALCEGGDDGAQGVGGEAEASASSDLADVGGGVPELPDANELRANVRVYAIHTRPRRDTYGHRALGTGPYLIPGAGPDLCLVVLLYSDHRADGVGVQRREVLRCFARGGVP